MQIFLVAVHDDRLQGLTEFLDEESDIQADPGVDAFPQIRVPIDFVGFDGQGRHGADHQRKSSWQAAPAAVSCYQSQGADHVPEIAGVHAPDYDRRQGIGDVRAETRIPAGLADHAVNIRLAARAHGGIGFGVKEGRRHRHLLVAGGGRRRSHLLVSLGDGFLSGRLRSRNQLDRSREPPQRRRAAQWSEGRRVLVRLARAQGRQRDFGFVGINTGV